MGPNHDSCDPLASEALAYAHGAFLRGLQQLAERQSQAACCSFASACRALKGFMRCPAAAEMHAAALVRVCECKLRLRELKPAVSLSSYLLDCDSQLSPEAGHFLLTIRGLSLLGLGQAREAMGDLYLALRLAPEHKRHSLVAALQAVRMRIATSAAHRKQLLLAQQLCNVRLAGNPGSRQTTPSPMPSTAAARPPPHEAASAGVSTNACASAAIEGRSSQIVRAESATGSCCSSGDQYVDAKVVQRELQVAQRPASTLPPRKRPFPGLDSGPSGKRPHVS